MVQPVKRRLAALLLCLVLTGCRGESALDGLSQKDANLALSELSRVGIPASRETNADNTYAITVRGDDLVEALQTLNAAGLPQRTSQSIPELFPGDGLIVTPFELKARLAYAQNEEVRRQLLAIEGVVDALVRISASSDQPRLREPMAPTASAVVTLRPGVDPLATTVKLKSVIAAAVQGLDYQGVTVVTTPAATMEAAVGVEPDTAFSLRGMFTILAFALLLATLALAVGPQTLQRLRGSTR